MSFVDSPVPEVQECIALRGISADFRDRLALREFATASTPRECEGSVRIHFVQPVETRPEREEIFREWIRQRCEAFVIP